MALPVRVGALGTGRPPATDRRGRLATAPRYQWAVPVYRLAARDQYLRPGLTIDAGELTIRAELSRGRTPDVRVSR
ncbi:hypothetical protein EV384_3164 [Micromonospora kangleipakensis]|uniref:Uncharacterized protein n=1 Tax=Micromonospora kangleipakensis TaxID=1077942 RepID=A0A4Q8BAV8_9ACTN|nr:hypothetical protein EV384_3164 [Micromonospora kangleipakensis]